VVLGHNLGLLWFDWLHRQYAEDGRAFVREVAAPLAAGAVVACAVGAYQGFVDLTFMSGHLWPHMGRAAGTLMDGNAFGMIAALWAPGLVALAFRLAAPWSAIVGAAGLGLSFVGVYTSGSRTALVALAISGLFIAYQSWRSWRESSRSSRSFLAR